MNIISKLIVLTSTSMVLAACTHTPFTMTKSCTTSSPCVGSAPSTMIAAPQYQATPAPTVKETEIIEVMPREPIIVRSTGYSAPPTGKSFSRSQNRLMTMRGSKIDALRNLAERVYGVEINANNSVSNMIAQSDEIRAYVDAYLVGAKVVSQRELEDGTFETVVELALQQNFRQCVSSVEALRSNPNCLSNNSYKVSASGSNQIPTSFYNVQ